MNVEWDLNRLNQHFVIFFLFFQLNFMTKNDERKKKFVCFNYSTNYKLKSNYLFFYKYFFLLWPTPLIIINLFCLACVYIMYVCGTEKKFT